MADIFSRLPGICTQVLGEAIEWLPSGGGSVALRGIFDNTFAVADVFADAPGIAGSQPRLHLKSTDAGGIVSGSSIRVRGTAYKVVGEPEPDGMGMTTFMLHRA